ncbi:hypothetical protein ES708_02372 [subsurface metagenome]
MSNKVRYFLTVEWCHNGQRGIFTDRTGTPSSKETPHTTQEMDDILDSFSIILNPQSLPFTEEQLAEYTTFHPLAEYSDAYGIVLKTSNQG